jgi:hypothetical protein
MWVTGAVMHAKHGNVLDAVQYLGYAVRWHPLGVVSGMVSIASRIASYLRRHWQDATSVSIEAPAADAKTP